MMMMGKGGDRAKQELGCSKGRDTPWAGVPQGPGSPTGGCPKSGIAPRAPECPQESFNELKIGQKFRNKKK